MKASLRAAILMGASFLALAMCLSSCGRRLPARLTMDSNPVFTGGTGWIVVTEAYVRMKAEPSREAPDVGHLRGGDTLAVLGRERFPPEAEVWFKVKADGKEGWIHSRQAAFYEAREPAERAAAQYR